MARARGPRVNWRAQMFVASTSGDQQGEQAHQDLNFGHGEIRGGQKRVSKDEKDDEAHARAHRETTAQEREQLLHRPWPVQDHRRRTDERPA